MYVQKFNIIHNSSHLINSIGLYIFWTNITNQGISDYTIRCALIILMMLVFWIIFSFFFFKATRNFFNEMDFGIYD